MLLPPWDKFTEHNVNVSYRPGSRTLRPQDTSAPRHFGITKLVPKFKPNHRWSCVSSELSWVKVSRLFLDHGTCVEVSRTTFLVSKCLEIGVLMPKCLVAEVAGNHRPHLYSAFGYFHCCVFLGSVIIIYLIGLGFHHVISGGQNTATRTH